MTINRYNYEAFFLLYADGELNPLEKGMVDQFVQLHPDLKEELDILMDCKLAADMPIFPKEKLYKQTIWDADNLSDMQANLLLLVDGELTEGFKKELEKKIEENPLLQREWNTLQQAKLPVETVLHPYKQPLYKQRKFAKMGWLRWAAAAALIIGAGWFVLDKNVNGNHKVEATALANGTPKQYVVDAQPKSSEMAGNNGTANVETTIAKTKTLDENNGKAIKKPIKANGHPSPKNIAINAEKEIPKKVTNNQYLAMNDDPTTDVVDGRVPLITHKTNDNIGNVAKVKPMVATLKAPKIGQITTLNTLKKPQSIAELQQDAEENEYVRIAGARVKKQKIRGVFRGVLRGIGRTFSGSKVEAAPALAINNE